MGILIVIGFNFGWLRLSGWHSAVGLCERPGMLSIEGKLQGLKVGG
jgi:hypothetical protein